MLHVKGLLSRLVIVFVLKKFITHYSFRKYRCYYCYDGSAEP